MTLLDILPASARPYAKALLALLTPLLLYVLHGAITGEWPLDALELLITSLLTGGAVYAQPNERKRRAPQNEPRGFD